MRIAGGGDVLLFAGSSQGEVPPVSPEDYEKNVILAYQGEAYGEALFEALAATAGDEDIAYKWRVLARLETENKERLIPIVRRIGGEAALAPTRDGEAAADAAERRDLSWAENMAIYAPRAPGLEPIYTELLAAAGTAEDRAAMQGLIDHSRGFFEVVRREIAGEADTLAPVLALLAAAPAR